MKRKTKAKPHLLAERTCSGFLFLPMTLEGETRWMCHATWLEKYYVQNAYDLKPTWMPVQWLSEKEVRR